MDTIKTYFQKIAEMALRDDAQVEMLIVGGESLSIGFQKKKLDSFESAQTQTAGLRVLWAGHQGYAYTENLSEESLLRTYKEALSNSKIGQDRDKQKVPLLKPHEYQEMNDLYAPQDISMAQKMDVARLLEEQCLTADPRVQSVPYSGFDEGMYFKRILNSEGLDVEFKQNYFSGYSYTLAKQGESSKMDGESFFVRNFNEINVLETTSKSVQKALSRLGAQKAATGNYPVVISRDQFPMILQMITSYFSAKDVDEGKSLFKGKLGQKIASDKFSLIDDPFNTKGRAIRPFDDEGAGSQITVLFEGGVLKNYLTNLEYSAKLSLPHTAHASRSPTTALGIAPTNLQVWKGNKTLPELLSSYPKVIYLTEFAGGLHAGFKEATGDFSMPAEGFLYENGKVVGPIDQFVVSGNVLELLRDIEEVGNEYNKPGNSKICPDVLIKSLSIAGA